MNNFLSKLFSNSSPKAKQKQLAKFSSEVESIFRLLGFNASVRLVPEGESYILKASVSNEQDYLLGNNGKQLYNLQQLIYVKAKVEKIDAKITLDVNSFHSDRRFKDQLQREISGPARYNKYQHNRPSNRDSKNQHHNPKLVNN